MRNSWLYYYLYHVLNDTGFLNNFIEHKVTEIIISGMYNNLNWTKNNYQIESIIRLLFFSVAQAQVEAFRKKHGLTTYQEAKVSYLSYMLL